MILVDSSVWIDLFRSRPQLGEEDLFHFAVCGPIVQEVLQGLKPGAASDAFRACFLALPVLSDPIPLELYVAAADMYRSGRRRGLTIRSSVDCLIAAIAIENRVPVWHKDRDFAAIATFTDLAVV
jgi:hypothetical protein